MKNFLVLFPFLLLLSCGKIKANEEAEKLKVGFEISGVKDVPHLYLVKMSWTLSEKYSEIFVEKAQNNSPFSKASVPGTNSYSEQFTSSELWAFRLVGVLNEKKYLLFKKDLIIPKDLVVQNQLSLEESIRSPFSRIFLSENSVLKTNGKNLVIDVAEIHAQNNSILDTIPKGSAGLGEKGKDGGKLLIKSKKLLGALTILSRGQNGGEGMPGSKGTQGKDGAHGQDASSLCAERPNEASTPGQRSEDGGPGGQGGDGQRGGDTALLRIELESLEGDLKIIEEAGGGGPAGEGGEGGNPGIPGKGGRGYSTNRGGALCREKPNGGQGKIGSRGPKGFAGQKGENAGYCLRVETKPTLDNCERISSSIYNDI
jgi:hypothetical protein